MSTTADAQEKQKTDSSMWESLQQALSDSILRSLDTVIESRASYFSNPKHRRPTAADIPEIISSYATKNTLISAGANIMPGLVSMAAAAPEIGFVMRNQISMVYDIGVAYGKEDRMSKELIAGIVMSSVGAVSGSIVGRLILVEGQKIIVQRVSLRAFQAIIKHFGARVLQQLLKSTISKWLPVAGALAMGAWSNFSTRAIGKIASTLLQKEVVDSESIPDTDEKQPSEHPTEDASDSMPKAETLSEPRIRILIALMQADQVNNPEEKEFIISIIKMAEISEDKKDALIELVRSDKQIEVNFTEHSLDKECAIAYLAEMAALAVCDRQFHKLEEEFIFSFGKAQKILENEISDIIEGAKNTMPQNASHSTPDGSAKLQNHTIDKTQEIPTQRNDSTSSQSINNDTKCHATKFKNSITPSLETESNSVSAIHSTDNSEPNPITEPEPEASIETFNHTEPQPKHEYTNTPNIERNDTDAEPFNPSQELRKILGERKSDFNADDYRKAYQKTIDLCIQAVIDGRPFSRNHGFKIKYFKQTTLNILNDKEHQLADSLRLRYNDHRGSPTTIASRFLDEIYHFSRRSNGKPSGNASRYVTNIDNPKVWGE